MAAHEEGFFTAKDNLRLFWETDAPPGGPKAVVSIIHGFADHIGRYRATRDALLKGGLAVHGYDMRGHGQSDGKRGHVDAFADYVDDFRRFMAREQEAAKGAPRFLLAHSNGALVALLALLEEDFGLAGAVLSSPFLGLAFEPPKVKVLAAEVFDKLLPSLTLGNELKLENLSRDPAWQASTAKDPLYHRVVSSRWFMESRAAQARVLAGAERFKLPVLLLTGEVDPIAAPAVNKAFFARLGSADKQHKEYPQMRHEVLNELGKEEVWADVVRWICAHLAVDVKPAVREGRR